MTTNEEKVEKFLQNAKHRITGKPLAERSIKTYRNVYKKHMDYLFDPEEIKSRLNDLKHSEIVAINALYRYYQMTEQEMVDRGIIMLDKKEEENSKKEHKFKPLSYYNDRLKKGTGTAKEKAILSIKLNHRPLRSDLVFVKIKNYKEDGTENYYKDGVIHMNVFVKVKGKPFTIKLEPETKKLVEESLKDNDSDYLVGFQNWKDRSKEFSRYIFKISEKVLGHRIGIDNFRHIWSRDEMNKIEKLKTERAKNTALIRLAKEMNTSSENIRNYYLQVRRLEPVDTVIGGQKVRIMGDNIKIELLD